MNRFFFIIIFPAFCFANNLERFETRCGDINYEIHSFCKPNNLRSDQDKINIPICEKQVFYIAGKKIDLSRLTGFATRLDHNEAKVRMMNFVFNGFSCKQDRVILSGYGGCNSCGELFKEFDFSGNEIKESSDSVDLKPMENIITGFSS